MKHQLNARQDLVVNPVRMVVLWLELEIADVHVLDNTRETIARFLIAHLVRMEEPAKLLVENVNANA